METILQLPIIKLSPTVPGGRYQPKSLDIPRIGIGVEAEMEPQERAAKKGRDNPSVTIGTITIRNFIEAKKHQLEVVTSRWL